ncbi:EAL domain-containing response regulator [Hirschia baltica]|uniref:Response regulator receiver modulated diguanylate phosphodiesterase n=1 Tax=Hirschia baltica (strain ATCC 49814 / DSM 5838 / IFAM 1418) TaxID=582402 RepID=C6XLK7_HIRBI|nr:EAL domain-containing response regulator [Hirschia baltica]ACT57913.1 response regulator receiver modulated diguanylate phosphodiesterase [Hirschia baltica ATCC 49814]
MSFSHALVVDDDPVFHIVAQDVIRAQGIEKVDTALDGQHALEILQRYQHLIEIIFCDLNMPNMDGVTLIRELGKLSYHGALVIVSSEDLDLLDTVTRLARIQRIDVLGTIKKPFTAEALQTVLSHISTPMMGTTSSPSDAHLWSGKRVSQYIDERRFNPFYQPKLSLISKRVESVEVLGRVLNDSGEYESPMNFLEAAETYGTITRATEDLAEQVARDLQIWQRQGRHLKASLNFSPLSLSDIQLPDRLERIFKLHDIDRRLITLEVVENKVMSYGADMLDVLARFRLKGFRLSLDDFGTGAASIEQLRLYPFNELKIDQSFIKDVVENPFSRIAVETAMKMAKQLDLRVVAEGIETKETLQYVRRLGVDEVQGYLIARPMTASQFNSWILDINARSKNVRAKSVA